MVDSEPLLMTSAVQSQDPLVMEGKVVGGGGRGLPVLQELPCQETVDLGLQASAVRPSWVPQGEWVVAGVNGFLPLPPISARLSTE